MWFAMLVMRVFARRTAVLVHCSVKTRARVVYNVVRVREAVVMIFVLTDPLNGWSLSVLKTDNVAPTLVLSEKPDIEGRTLKPTSSSYIAGRTRKSTSSSKGVKKGGSTAMLSHQPVFRLTGHLETNCQEKRVWFRGIQMAGTNIILSWYVSLLETPSQSKNAQSMAYVSFEPITKRTGTPCYKYTCFVAAHVLWRSLFPLSFKIFWLYVYYIHLLSKIYFEAITL